VTHAATQEGSTAGPDDVRPPPAYQRWRHRPWSLPDLVLRRWDHLVELEDLVAAVQARNLVDLEPRPSSWSDAL
jgi:hypothetical protein